MDIRLIKVENGIVIETQPNEDQATWKTYVAMTDWDAETLIKKLVRPFFAPKKRETPDLTPMENPDDPDSNL